MMGLSPSFASTQHPNADKCLLYSLGTLASAMIGASLCYQSHHIGGAFYFATVPLFASRAIPDELACNDKNHLNNTPTADAISQNSNIMTPSKNDSDSSCDDVVDALHVTSPMSMEMYL